MQRQRSELVPIGDALSSMNGPVKALRDTSPQAVHHFTQADQVNQLVSASEADPDLGFMARMMALCSLPRSNPGNRLQYKRVNGPYTLYMNAVGGCKLPFGNLPRLLMAWLSTEAVRTQSRELVLGRSLAEFMRTLGVLSSDSGGASGVRTRLRNQMRRLFNAHVRSVSEGREVWVKIRASTAKRAEWHAKARSVGLSLSDLVRRSVGRVRTWTVAHAELERERTRELARIGSNLNQIARWANIHKEDAEVVVVVAHLVAIERELGTLVVQGESER